MSFDAAVVTSLRPGYGKRDFGGPATALLRRDVMCALGVYALVQIGLARYFWRLGKFNPF